MTDATQAPAVRRFGAFEINFQSGELRKNGMRLRLSGQPFQVLAVLTQRAGELVTREELHSKLWPSDTFVDFDHGLNNAVARIREVLDDSSGTPRYIETVPRRGYRFIAPLTDIRPTAAQISEPVASIEPAISPPISSFTKQRPSRPAKLLLGTVTAIALCIIGVLLYRAYTGSGKQPPIKSIAVLPLANLSGDSSQDYLADGMTEELIGRLASVRNLRVISRTSVMQFKGTKQAVPEIAKTLGVDALVEGSVIRDGNRIRVHAQLIRAATDEHFWSETYDRELSNALALESEVAQSIAEKVEVTVSGEEHARLANTRTVSPEVYEAYLKGRFALDHYRNRDDIEKSIQYFEEATQKDPAFAPAYVGLANAYSHLRTIFIGERPEPLDPKVVNSVRKALELDSQLAEAHLVLANAEVTEWHWAEAETEYKYALQLNPNDASAHLAMANWLLSQGRSEEALTWARRARELDPILVTADAVGWILFCEHRYDQAINEWRSDLALKPDDPGTLWRISYALIARGSTREAITSLERAIALSHGSAGPEGVLVRAYALAGRRTDALRLLDELNERNRKGYVPAAAFVNAYLGVGDIDKALFWLGKACDEHSNIILWLKVHPHFDPLRNDPRFLALLHRVGLDRAN